MYEHCRKILILFVRVLQTSGKDFLTYFAVNENKFDFLPTMNVYCVKHVKSSIQLKKAEARTVPIVFKDVLCHVHVEI